VVLLLFVAFSTGSAVQVRNKHQMDELPVSIEPTCTLEARDKLKQELFAVANDKHGWSNYDVERVFTKLNYIDINSLDDLQKATDENNLNSRLEQIGANPFTAATLKLLPQQKTYYFAYGSNMNEARMKERGVHYSERQLGSVDGYTLAFNKRAGNLAFKAGYANLMPTSTAPGPQYGIVYTLHSRDEFLKLDKFEGTDSFNYFRKVIAVTTPGGQILQAVTYFAGRLEDELLPTAEYISHLWAGQDLLPPEYVKRLKAWKTLA